MWNQARLPRARGIRLRGHALQLHGDRRQPARPRPRSWATPWSGSRPHRPMPRAATTSCGCSRRRACRRASSTSCPATPAAISGAVLSHAELAGMHFTGSTEVFNSHVEDDRREHRRATGPIPRIVGETGGKDFIVAHASADPVGARRRDRARRLRVPGPEVLGRRAESTCRVRSGQRRARPRGRHDARRSGSATSAISATSWAPSSTHARFEKHRRLHRGRAGERAHPGGRRRPRRARATSSSRRSSRAPRSGLSPDVRGDLRAGRHRCSSTTTRAGPRRWPLVDRTSPYALTGARLRPGPARRARGRRRPCATRPATSTSTTSPRAPSSGSSRSAARAARARTTRPAPS